MFKRRKIKNDNQRTNLDTSLNFKNDNKEKETLKYPSIEKIEKKITNHIKDKNENIKNNQKQIEIKYNDLEENNFNEKQTHLYQNGIRILGLTDYQPDICKDFMQTGYCGYGDTCKFSHIRGESKNKKPLKKLWKINTVNDFHENKQKKKDPDLCSICKKDLRDPIKTNCDHVFCKECAMTRFKIKNKSKCYVCKKETNGIFIFLNDNTSNTT